MSKKDELTKKQLQNLSKKNELTKKEMRDLLMVAGAHGHKEFLRANANFEDAVRVKAVAASAYQVLNLALIEPKDSAMTKHLVHCATVALGTIEE